MKGRYFFGAWLDIVTHQGEKTARAWKGENWELKLMLELELDSDSKNKGFSGLLKEIEHEYNRRNGETRSAGVFAVWVHWMITLFDSTLFSSTVAVSPWSMGHMRIQASVGKQG